ncbi:30S ribosomal protein S7 [Rubinisphaera italica]|uniref:Small ribosomal subunit protein uS7 n=1 Tax=Rubinisphaera italica TaxID=2527969 RepID=A0A5C5XLI9_9PLAN|nr:30S ribosomal protein S7 [Rubinisphaera italica]TWT63558.1 30S ribosomal protein S7 [Rubinisphaera italica]
MAKRFTASVSQLKPDPRFNSILASKFVNCLMLDGKKSTAQRAFYDALEIIKQRMPEDSEIEVFERALENCKPYIEVKSKRVGGATYQVPTPVKPKRQQTLAIRWVLAAARGRKGRPISQSLAEEFMSASRREGTAMTTRENVHRMADANKAFAHFAW